MCLRVNLFRKKNIRDKFDIFVLYSSGISLDLKSVKMSPNSENQVKSDLFKDVKYYVTGTIEPEVGFIRKENDNYNNNNNNNSRR